MRYLSLFSGIEAASVAWQPLGWECAGVAEIEPFPCAVLKHHYPDVPNLGSVLGITGEMIAALGPIDVVVGGSPCQDLSVAGKRAGLVGERSNLFHQQIRIFHAARLLCGARWLVWENVPGAFSSHAGADFAAVVGAMAGCSVAAPAKGWGTEGVALGKHGLVEWCVLDAQWFGVAQRRRRVFAVLDTGDWASRAPILLERDSLRGDSPPSREAREDAPASAARGTGGGDGLEQPFAVANCLTRRMAKGINSTVDEGQTPVLAHTLRGEGFDASEDGTGRGTPLVPVQPYTLAIRGRGDSHDLEYRQDGTANALLTPNGGRAGIGVGAIAFMADDYKDGGHEECDTARPLTTSADRTRAAPVIAFSGKDYGADAGEVAPTLRGMGHDSSHANGGGQVAVAFHENQRAEVSLSGTAGAVKCAGGKPGRGYPAALINAQVRRLTAEECESLQGFPRGYTAIAWRGKPADQCPDGPRYKALGNSMAVPVMRWIGRQIAKVTLL